MSVGVKLLFPLIMICSYFSMAYLLSVVGWVNNGTFLVLIRFFAPSFLSLLAGAFGLLLVCTTPAFVAACLSFCRSPTWTKLTAAMVCTIQPLHAHLFCINAINWSGWLIFGKDIRFDWRLIIKIGTLAIAFLVTNLHWLYPIIADTAYLTKTISNEANSSNLQWINGDAGLFRTLTMTGFWIGIFFKSFGRGNPIVRLMFYGHLLFIWTISIKAHAQHHKTRDLFFFGLFVVSFLIAKGYAPPFIQPLSVLEEKTIFGILFRSPQNAVYQFIVLSALFFASGISKQTVFLISLKFRTLLGCIAV